MRARPLLSRGTPTLARVAIAAARAALADGGARTEALAVLEPEHRWLGLRRPARMRPIGQVWRLGVVLLTPDGALYATGRTTRATPPGHGGHVAASIEERRELRATAYRGSFGEGATVDFDAQPIDLDEAALRDARTPVFLRADGVVRVRWSQWADDDACPPLDAYLRERVDLLLHPPQGATD